MRDPRVDPKPGDVLRFLIPVRLRVDEDTGGDFVYADGDGQTWSGSLAAWRADAKGAKVIEQAKDES